MPKYYQYKVFGYYLYFTSHCIMECMHAHASNVKLDEKGSAKFYIKSNGDSIVTKKGKLSDIEINKISRFIKVHYKEMYLLWSTESEKGFYYSSK